MIPYPFIGFLFGIATAITADTPPAKDSSPPMRREADSISGYYRVKGIYKDTTYAGIAKIEDRGEMLLFQWWVDSKVTNGFGLRKGNFIAVSWPGPDGKTRGQSLYEVKATVLRGSWMMLEDGKGTSSLRQEELRFLSALDETEKVVED